MKNRLYPDREKKHGRTDDTPGPLSRPAPTRAVLGARTDGRTAKRHVTRDGSHASMRATSPVPAGRQLGLSSCCLRRAGDRAANHEDEEKAPEAGPSPAPGLTHGISGAASRICTRSGRPGGGSREFQLRTGPPVDVAARSDSDGLASRRFSAGAPTLALRLPDGRALHGCLPARSVDVAGRLLFQDVNSSRLARAYLHATRVSDVHANATPCKLTIRNTVPRATNRCLQWHLQYM
jgi:hypothetical protein